MTETTPLSAVLARAAALDAEDQTTLSLILTDVMDAMETEGGGGVMFVDTTGCGNMNVHLMGDQSIAPHMLRAAPAIYRKMFSVPDGEAVQ